MGTKNNESDGLSNHLIPNIPVFNIGNPRFFKKKGICGNLAGK